MDSAPHRPLVRSDSLVTLIERWCLRLRGEEIHHGHVLYMEEETNTIRSVRSDLLGFSELKYLLNRIEEVLTDGNNAQLMGIMGSVERLFDEISRVPGALAGIGVWSAAVHCLTSLLFRVAKEKAQDRKSAVAWVSDRLFGVVKREKRDDLDRIMASLGYTSKQLDMALEKEYVEEMRRYVERAKEAPMYHWVDEPSSSPNIVVDGMSLGGLKDYPQLLQDVCQLAASRRCEALYTLYRPYENGCTIAYETLFTMWSNDRYLFEEVVFQLIEAVEASPEVDPYETLSVHPESSHLLRAISMDVRLFSWMMEICKRLLLQCGSKVVARVVHWGTRDSIGTLDDERAFKTFFPKHLQDMALVLKGEESRHVIERCNSMRREIIKQCCARVGLREDIWMLLVQFYHHFEWACGVTEYDDEVDSYVRWFTNPHERDDGG